MRARSAIVVAAFWPAAVVSSCATARPVKSAPTASHARPSHASRPSSPAAPSSPPPPDEQRLATAYASHRVLSVQEGQASYYGNSLAGHKTASGERYDPRAFTAAHRTLALGTIARVRRRDNGAYVYVRITDRGPFGSAHRIIDLSRAAAERLGMIRIGVTEVRLEVLEYGQRERRRR